MQNIITELTVYIPISFPNIDSLVDGTGLKADKIRVFLNQLFLSRLSQSGYTGKQKDNPLNWIYKDGYVSIHSAIIKKLLTTKMYHKYLTFLQDKNLVTVRESPSSKRAYTPGFTSKHFKIAPDLLHASDTNRHFRTEAITDICTIKAVLRTRDLYIGRSGVNARSISQDVIHQKLFDMEKLVKFHIYKADKWITEYLNAQINLSEIKMDSLKYNQGLELELINAINDGYFNTKVDQFGKRLYSPLKRVSRRMRPFMYFAGYEDEELICMDICNSQLYFSTLLSNADIVKSVIPEFQIVSELAEPCKNNTDFTEYVNYSIDGTIYDKWQEARAFETRDQAKRELIQVLFSGVKSKMPGVKIFRKQYPSVSVYFDSIKSLTENELPFITKTYLDSKGIYKEDAYHCNLSCAVQRLESHIFIKLICSALLNANAYPFFTIHDSIYFLKKHEGLVNEIISKEFMRLGVTPPKIKSGKM